MKICRGKYRIDTIDLKKAGRNMLIPLLESTQRYLGSIISIIPERLDPIHV